ncbi:ATP-binding protein [Cochleicola gelatinilyticus]|uniref:histidine kinase n=1 Tax=Cochleicola gelatinilyticus TaxID=1763537 RepID=A0A167KF73_9FLAO|nr:ATP-binding protein [Cochleicola gelatinilyticus]OAB81827.1 hypothetical protein ULVI_00370 [Cochleicola gelatinilyticus]
MKLIAPLILAMLFFGTSYCQTSSDGQKDIPHATALKIKIDLVDSLVRYTRNQFYKNNFDIVIETGNKTRKLAREIKDTASISALSSLIGNSYLQIKDTIEAKKVFSDAILEAEQLKDSSSMLTARIDLGNFYGSQEKGDYAIRLYKEAIPLAKKIGSNTRLFILNYNIAEISLGQKDISKAEYYVNETNKFLNDSMNNVYKAVAKINNGKLHFLKKNPAIAIIDLKEGIELAELTGYTDPLIDGYEFYAQSLSMLGDYKAAYLLSQKIDTLKIEKYKTDKIEAIESVTAQYKLNQYKQELKAKTLQNIYNKQTAKKETTIQWIKIASGILLMFSIIIYISYLKRKKLVVSLIDKNKQYLKAKEKSEEYAKAKNILFSNITHELRTPMYGIIGISSLLLNDKKLEHHQDSIRSLKFSANYLLSLVNNVLQLTKIDATKKNELFKHEFNLRLLVENVVKSSQFINKEHPNKYIITIDDAVPTNLLGDDLKLSQILINLIGNASKFTNNGTVSITVKNVSSIPLETCLAFTITDTGIGISKEKQEHIFNEFSQSYTNSNYQGSGLGLPIVKKLLELHNTDIHLKSEVNKGTTVSFKINYEAATPIRTIKKENKIDISKKFQGLTILVVDDNKINQIVTKRTLELYGTNVIVAGSGKEGIEVAKKEKLDLILMDINMPEMNGFEATAHIKAFQPALPIIALTAVELEKMTEDDAFNLLDDTIIKPYDNQEFITTISSHVFKEQEIVVTI